MIDPATILAILLTCLLLAAAALHDVAVRTVPNVIPGLLLLIGLVWRLCDHSLLFGLAACASVFIATAIFWRRGWMGGGDVKLYAACALVVPPGLVLSFVLASAVIGGVLAVLYIVLNRLVPAQRRAGRPAGWMARLVRVERRRISHGGPLPYAAAIALGAMLTLVGA